MSLCTGEDAEERAREPDDQRDHAPPPQREADQVQGDPHQVRRPRSSA